MLLPRLFLIPVLLVAQVCSAACGRSLFVWCLGPHGELKLELPHDSCRHDCDEELPAPVEPSIHGEALLDPHGCDDVPADMTVPAMRRAPADLAVADLSDAPALQVVLDAPRRTSHLPRVARARGSCDRPPPEIRALRTVRLLV